MLNYMKSECYRTLKGKGFYKAIAILCGLVLAMNVILAICQHYLPDFRYGTFRFSLNMYTSSVFSTVVLGAIVPAGMFLDDKRNGVLKNVVSYGIEREKLFLGKCLVAFFFTVLVLCAVLAVYVGSAYVLLQNPEWEPLREMLMGVAASLPSATASLVLLILLGTICQKDMTAVFVWVTVYYLIPNVLFLAGLKVDLLGKIFEWMPYGFLRMEVIVTLADYQCIWNSAAGFSKCMIAGILGIIIFLAAGIWKIRRQEF